MTVATAPSLSWSAAVDRIALEHRVVDAINEALANTGLINARHTHADLPQLSTASDEELLALLNAQPCLVEHRQVHRQRISNRILHHDNRSAEQVIADYLATVNG